jgi:hypothetical protein
VVAGIPAEAVKDPAQEPRKGAMKAKDSRLNLTR